MVSPSSWHPLPFSLAPFSVALAALFAAPATSQCSTMWLPGQPLAGTNGDVLALAEWDPDGAGPHTPVVVAGGTFTVAGGVIANRIATYDRATQSWANLGVGMSGTVQALAVLQNGDLVAAGSFSSAGGAPASSIAQWNGTSWSPLAGGVSGTVNALTVLPSGELVVGGAFTFITSDGEDASYLAQWDGLGWSKVGQGVNSMVESLATLPNGDLVASGWFTTAGGVPSNRIARWNGATWSPLGAGAVSMIREVLAMPNGDVIAAGFFQGSTHVRVARWNGTTWTVLGAGLASVDALARLPNGDIVATGASIDIRRWDGTAWTVFGTVDSYEARALTVLQNGDLVAGGSFRGIHGVPADFVAIWNGANWSPTAPWAEGRVRITALTTLPDGDVVAGIGWTNPNAVGGFPVQRWNGATWSQMGPHFIGGEIRAILRRPNGDIVATGGFSSVGGVAVNGIASWNGSSWQPLGAGLGPISLGYGGGHSLLNLPNGDLLVGGGFGTAQPSAGYRIATWDGTSWTDSGAGLPVFAATGFNITSLALLPNGDVVAGATTSDSQTPSVPAVFQRSTTSWLQVGNLRSGAVHGLAVLPNGDLVAAGSGLGPYPGAGQRVQRWNGQSWIPIVGITGTQFPTVFGLAVLPGGDLVVSGYFTSAGGAPAAGMARWNGFAWSSLATTQVGVSGVPASLGPIALHPHGDVLVGGGATMIDGVVSDRLARLTTTCPAFAATSGAGCNSSGGSNALVAETLPWLGSTHRVTATGLPANALALHVFGTTTAAVPLAALAPQGQPGCALLVSPDTLSVLVPSGGTTQFALAIPNDPMLIGALFHEQVVPIELNVTGGIVALTATNSLTLAIGAF